AESGCRIGPLGSSWSGPGDRDGLAPRYRGQSARRAREMRVVPRKVCLSSQLFGMEGFFICMTAKGAANMKETLETIRWEALAAFDGAGTAQDLDALRVKYLGKKGELTAVLKMMGKLSAEERPAMGQLANEVRAALEEALEAKGK